MIFEFSNISFHLKKLIVLYDYHLVLKKYFFICFLPAPDDNAILHSGPDLLRSRIQCTKLLVHSNILHVLLVYILRVI